MRRDPILDQWVIVAEDRAHRPAAFVSDDGIDSSRDNCPFCEGHEGETLPEVLALRAPGTPPNGPGWRIRVFPNRYPALDSTCAPEPIGDGDYRALKGGGVHEVIVEGPGHTRSMTELSEVQVREALEVYQNRFLAHSSDRRLQTVVLIKNVGSAAGASIAHSHSQLVGTPVLPPRLSQEMEAARRAGGCLWCKLLDEEIRRNERIVHAGERIVALCPYAPRFPYETWLLPTRHVPHFEAANKSELDDLACLLRRVLAQVERALPTPPYNYLIHTAPFRDERSSHYHWRMEILPRVSRAAGFEQGTGLFINTVSPERSARELMLPRNLS